MSSHLSTQETSKLINRQALKALRGLTNGNPLVVVSTRDIIRQVKQELRQDKNITDLNRRVKESLNVLEETGLIEGAGRLKYRLLALQQHNNKNNGRTTPPPKRPIPVPVNPDPENFKVVSKKRRLPENSSALDPNRKQRNSEEISSDSLSGDELDQARKLFHGKKKIKKLDRKVNLPGARQVEQNLETSSSSSGDRSPVEGLMTFSNQRVHINLKRTSSSRVYPIDMPLTTTAREVLSEIRKLIHSPEDSEEGEPEEKDENLQIEAGEECLKEEATESSVENPPAEAVAGKETNEEFTKEI